MLQLLHIYILDKCLLMYFYFTKSFAVFSVIFSQIISQKINFLCKFELCHTFENSAFRLFHLASRLVPRLECMDASVCSHKVLFLVPS